MDIQGALSHWKTWVFPAIAAASATLAKVMADGDMSRGDWMLVGSVFLGSVTHYLLPTPGQDKPTQ